jgi:hypothetical protein
MNVRESADRSTGLRSQQIDLLKLPQDRWAHGAAILEGPRRTYLVLLERLEQSRVILRDLTARLRRHE